MDWFGIISLATGLQRLFQTNYLSTLFWMSGSTLDFLKIKIIWKINFVNHFRHIHHSGLTSVPNFDSFATLNENYNRFMAEM